MMKVLALLPLLLAASSPHGSEAFGLNRAASSTAAGATALHMSSLDFVDPNIDNCFDANLAWKAQKEKEDPYFFNKLGTVHKPTYMWIGCADARVPPNEIMGVDAGEVFVVRNVANMVESNDVSLHAAIQFAVNALKVQHIIVCGHYNCGGVRASCTNVDHAAPLENWLRNIRDVYRTHREELDAIEDPEKRHRRLVEINVLEQCINLIKSGVIQKRRIDTKWEVDVGNQPYATPKIHGLVFDPATGKLTRVKDNLQEHIEDLQDIYDLYGG